MRVETKIAIASGHATWARIIGATGRAVADFTVSTTKDGTGYMSFNTVDFKKGGPVAVFAGMALFGELAPHDDDVRRE
jgi:hypothetical protein